MKSATKKPFNRGRFYRLVAVSLIFTLLIAYIAISIYAGFTFTTASYRSLDTTPAAYGLPYEEVSFSSAASDKLTLRGWWIPNPKSSRTLIMVHGQGATRQHLLGLSKPLWERGYNLLFFDLRGHGLSDGDHHTLGLQEQWDVVGAASFIKSRGFKPASIGAIGWSMGAASVIMALSDTSDIQAGISDSGYADLSALHGIFYPGMSVVMRLMRGFDPDEVNPENSIKKLGNHHLFLIQGEQDRNVPISNFYKLKAAGDPNVTEVWVLPGLGHVAGFDALPDEYLRRVTAFFDKELI